MNRPMTISCASALLFVGAIVVSMSGGCAGSRPIGDGSEGSTLYYSRCRSCHRAYDPAIKSLDWWEANFHIYADRAHLTPVESDSVRAFVFRVVSNASVGEHR